MARYSELPAHSKVALEEAAIWLRRLEENPALEVSREFANWRSKSGNAAALEAVDRGLKQVQEFGSSPELLDMRRAALARIQRRPSRDWLVRHFSKIAAVLLVAAVVSAAIVYLQPTTYATGVGERRVVGLSDGSRVSLDSDSVIRVKFTDGARLIELTQGRARFDVAHDRTRPFKVTAGTETVIAVGTSFEVERLNAKVLVTLLQGHILVTGAAQRKEETARWKPLSMVPGQQLVAVRDRAPAVLDTNLQNVNAWEAGQLVFKDEPLSEAVERVNRYTDHPVLVDPSVADIHISGVFTAGDVSSFVSGITSYFAVQAETTSDDHITLQRKL